MEIRKLSILEYYLAFAGHHSVLSNRYAVQTEAGGFLLGARINGAYAGFLCVLDEVESLRIAFALTVPEYRNQNVFTGLVDHVLNTGDKNVRVNISTEHSCYEIIRTALIRLGFVSSEQVTVFSCSSQDRDKWEAFMEKKGKRLCAMLERRGFSAVSFRNLDADLIRQLRESDRSSYANMFHPAKYLDDPACRLDPDISFACVKDKDLAAYCLVTMGDPKSVMFDQISVSAKEQGQGVILLPYVYSMQSFFEHGLSAAYYAMYGSNRHANAFRNKVLSVFPTKESIMENFIYQAQARKKRTAGNIPEERHEKG